MTDVYVLCQGRRGGREVARVEAGGLGKRRCPAASKIGWSIEPDFRGSFFLFVFLFFFFRRWN